MKNHVITNIAVLERGWIGGGNTRRNTTVVCSNYLYPQSALQTLPPSATLRDREQSCGSWGDLQQCSIWLVRPFAMHNVGQGRNDTQLRATDLSLPAPRSRRARGRRKRVEVKRAVCVLFSGDMLNDGTRLSCAIGIQNTLLGHYYEEHSRVIANGRPRGAR